MVMKTILMSAATGIEFSAELHDLVMEDMAKLYPDLIKFFKVTVYDVASKVLPMFDEKLGQYAMDHLRREGIEIKTSHHVEELRKGPPSAKSVNELGERTCFTLKTKEDGEIGVGMCVWSTGLMMNPFVQKTSEVAHGLSHKRVEYANVDLRDTEEYSWVLRQHPRSGALLTDERLRLVLDPKEQANKDDKAAENTPRAILQDVYALGDCASVENTEFPATAQVASQKAEWLAKRLNKGDIDTQTFKFKNLGVMAYLGNWRAAFQPGSGGNISGFAAWVIWRGAYLTKAVSLRNKILIPTYCKFFVQ
jgi:NADH dehydrogenase